MIGSQWVEEPSAGAPSAHAHALAILENLHGNLRATPAFAILGSLLADEQRHPELLQLFRTRLVEPRRALLRAALAVGVADGQGADAADLDALTAVLVGSYARYLTVAGIPDDWPARVLSVLCPSLSRPSGLTHAQYRSD